MQLSPLSTIFFIQLIAGTQQNNFGWSQNRNESNFPRAAISTIVNGFESPNHEFYVRLVSLGRVATFFCGGTIVDPRWVVTTASCLHGLTTPLEVETGDFAQQQRQPTQRHKASFFIVHERYHAGHDKFNIALIKLARPIMSPMMHHVLPPCDGTEVKDELIAVGMGSIAQQFILLPRVLHQALFQEHKFFTVGFLNYERCLPYMVCTEPLLSKSHLGYLDNGSPLFLPKCGTQMPLCLYGVAAGCVESETCNRNNFIGKSQFVKVSFYFDWLKKKMKSSR